MGGLSGLSGLSGVSGLVDAVAAFAPDDVAGMLAWFDAAVVSGSTWTDRSGNGHDATLVGSPTVAASAINGHPAISFNGSSQYATVDSLAAALDGSDTEYSIYLVQKVVGTAASRSFHVGDNASSTPLVTGIGYSTTSKWYSYRRTAAGSNQINTYKWRQQFNKFRYHSFRYATAGSKHVVGQDGHEITHSTPAIGDLGTLEYGTIAAGRHSAGPTVESYLQGSIAELILYLGAVSDSDDALLREYLYDKYFPDRLVSVSNQALTARSNWNGRPMLCDFGTAWAFVYREAADHSDDSDSVFHIRFSDDEGATWTADDVKLGGGAVSGFPMGGHSTNNVADAFIFQAPNGDLLVHAAERGSNTRYGTYQYRSTDDGATWSDEGQIVSADTSYQSTCQVVNIGTDMYAVCFYDPSPSDYTGPYETRLIKSTNNGTTWTYVSTPGSTTDNANEAAITHLGGSNLLVIMRHGDATTAYTYYRTSSDLGATWGTLYDISESVGLLHRPMLKRYNERLYLFGRDYQVADEEHVVVFMSDDNGATWSDAFFPNPTAYVDTGYADMLLRSDGDTWYMLTYAGSTTDADIQEYIFQHGPAGPPVASGDDSPDEFANLWGWWKADAGITKDGSDLVSNWADQSGNGRDLAQATGANQPLWVDAKQNSLPAVSFDGSNDLMAVASGVPATGTNSRCIIIVVIDPTISASNVYQHICHYGQANNDMAYGAAIRTYSLHTGGNTGPGNHWWGDGIGDDVAYTTGAESVLTIWYDGTDDHVRLNGAEVISETKALNTGSVTPFRVGSRITAGEYYQGFVGEIAVYAPAPDVGDIALIEAALMTRWGIA